MGGKGWVGCAAQRLAKAGAGGGAGGASAAVVAAGALLLDDARPPLGVANNQRHVLLRGRNCTRGRVSQGAAAPWQMAATAGWGQGAATGLPAPAARCAVAAEAGWCAPRGCEPLCGALPCRPPPTQAPTSISCCVRVRLYHGRLSAAAGARAAGGVSGAGSQAPGGRRGSRAALLPHSQGHSGAAEGKGGIVRWLEGCWRRGARCGPLRAAASRLLAELTCNTACGRGASGSSLLARPSLLLRRAERHEHPGAPIAPLLHASGPADCSQCVTLLSARGAPGRRPDQVPERPEAPGRWPSVAQRICRSRWRAGRTAPATCSIAWPTAGAPPPLPPPVARRRLSMPAANPRAWFDQTLGCWCCPVEPSSTRRYACHTTAGWVMA